MSAADPKFQRPATYDPELINQEERNKQVPAEKKLASDLGIDELENDFQLEEEGSGKDDLNSPSNVANQAAPVVDLSLYVPIAEHDNVVDMYKAASQARIVAEHSARKAEENSAHLLEMHRTAQAILVQRHKAQVKALRAELQEKKQLIDDDEAQIVELKRKLALLQSDTATNEDADAAVAAFAEARDLQRIVLEQKCKLQELAELETARQAELLEYKRAMDEANNRAIALEAAKGSVGDLQTLLDMQQQIDRLQLECNSRRAVSPTSASSSASFNAANDVAMANLVSELDGLRKSRLEADATIQKLRAQVSTLEAAATSGGASDRSAELAQAEAKIKQLTDELLSTANSLATFKTASESGTAGLTAELDQAKRANASLTEALAQKDALVKSSDALIKKREDQLKQLKDNAQTKLKEASEHIKKLKAEYANLREAYQALKVQSEENARRMHAQMIRQRSQSVMQRKKIIEVMTNTVGALRTELGQVRSQVTEMETGSDSVAMRIVQAVKKHSGANVELIKTLKENYEKELRMRKKLFNQLQELKGNIRVYARVRPLSDKELQDKRNLDVMSFLRDGELRIENSAKKQVHTFEFERVFKPDSKQEDVFDEVQDLVTSVIDGFNVCMFAYGQTGSGKTFTMEGPKEAPGVNTRALDKLFTEAASKSKEWNYSLRLTLLEIYNEKVQDLLSDSDDNLKVVNGPQGMEVLGLTQVEVTTAADVQKWLTKGKKNRHITKTDMNDHSSRSHLILSVYVAGKNKFTGATSFGKLHLIDLAGSERVGRSNVTGDALKEAQKINYSLSALGNVISARANKADHVPYRNSMLTYLLQDSLEKNSKTLMFVQLSPTLESVTETLCSLRFAERVRKVELGKAGKNVVAGSAGPAGGSGAARSGGAGVESPEMKQDEDYVDDEDAA